MRANQSAAANRRPAAQADGSGNLFAIVAADRAFPAAVAELGRLLLGPSACAPVGCHKFCGALPAALPVS